MSVFLVKESLDFLDLPTTLISALKLFNTLTYSNPMLPGPTNKTSKLLDNLIPHDCVFL